MNVRQGRLAVGQKNRAHKLLSVAHRLNLHAQMLQMKRGCISKQIYQSIKILTIISWCSCAVQVKSQRGRAKNDIECGFFVPQREGGSVPAESFWMSGALCSNTGPVGMIALSSSSPHAIYKFYIATYNDNRL